MLNLSKKILFLLLLLKVGSAANAQEGPLMLNWDKLGCQQDSINSVPINDDQLPCLKVCVKSMITYRLTGEYINNIDHIEWRVIGGKKIDSQDRLSTPIEWNESTTGSITMVLVMLNQTTFEKTICVEKADSSLIFGWDKTGCQMNKNNTNEFKLSSTLSNVGCLRVCEGSRVSYTISGKNTIDITSVVWEITGGSKDGLAGEESLTMPIIWDDSLDGSIALHITFQNGSILNKIICFKKFPSSLLLDWEKIEESAVRQIKVDTSPDNSECIIAYPNSTVMYKIDGNQIQNVDSIIWNVTGGIAYFPDEYTAIITWEDIENNAIEIGVVYTDGTLKTRTISIVMRNNPNGGDHDQVSISFAYDDAGNQKKRSMIYLTRQSSQNPKSDSNSTVGRSVIKSEEFDDISYFPNPVKSELYLKWTEEKGKILETIEVYDLNGKLLSALNDLNDVNDTTVNFENLAPGIYNLQMIYSDQETKILKIVKL